MLGGLKQNLVYTRTQRPHGDRTMPASECLSVSCRGTGHRGCRLRGCRHRGSACSRPGSHSLWQKPCWRRSPLAPPWSHRADNPQTAEQLRQINSPTVKKVLGPAIDFPTWGPSKGLRNPREFDFGGQWETEPTCLWLGVSCGFEPNNSEGTQTNPTGLD